MEHLILKYLQNDLSLQEAKELDKWLGESNRNREVFENLVSQWKITPTDVKQSRKRVFDAIVDEKQVNTVIKDEPSAHYKSIYKVAAVILLVITASLSLWIFSQNNQENKTLAVAKQSEILITKESGFGQKITFSLPDGTNVKLNSGSKLIFPKEFSSGERRVSLDGEAFFEVVPNKSKPFIIQSNDASIKVLGTSFNVQSYPDDDHIVVAVKSGKVTVNHKDAGDNIILNKKELAVFSSKTKKWNAGEIKDEEVFFGWVDQYLIFKDQDVHSILKVLSRWYDIDFRIYGNNLNNKKDFNAKYENPTLKTVMESLSHAYDFKYEINKEAVIIR